MSEDESFGLNEISQKDIEKLASQSKPMSNEYEVFAVTIPISIGIFWKRFLANDAKYSCFQFFSDEGHKDLDLDKWEPDQKRGNL